MRCYTSHKWFIGCNFLIFNVEYFASDDQARVTLRTEFEVNSIAWIYQGACPGKYSLYTYNPEVRSTTEKFF